MARSLEMKQSGTGVLVEKHEISQLLLTGYFCLSTLLSSNSSANDLFSSALRNNMIASGEALIRDWKDWDDAAAKLVLVLHGIEPAESEVRLRRLVDEIIHEKTDRGEEILESLR